MNWNRKYMRRGLIPYTGSRAGRNTGCLPWQEARRGSMSWQKDNLPRSWDSRAVSGFCSTGNAVHRRKCGIISQRPASAIRTVRHLDFRQSLQRYPIRRSGSFTEGGFPMKGYLRWQWSGQGSAVNMEESWLNGLQGGLRSAVWMS